MDPLVLAQPAIRDVYQPGREAISSMEAGQGLRARGMAIEQQQVENERANAEYARQTKIRELLGQNKYDDAKSYMTLAERNQLVNLQGNVLEQKIKGIELDMKEKALNDAYSFINDASKLDPNDPMFQQRATGLASRAAPIIANNPQYANAFGQTLTAKANEFKLTQKDKADKALELFYNVTADLAKNNAPYDVVLKNINDWQAQNSEAFSGPYGKELNDAKEQFVRQLNYESLMAKRLAGGEAGTEAFKPGQTVTDPASGRQVIWATSPASRIDVATGEPLYVRIMDPNNLSQEVLLRNPKIKGWGDAGAQKYLSEDPNASGLPTPVPDTISW